jgi:hypothetical protein
LIAIRTKPGAAGEDRLVARGPWTQRVDLAAGPQRHVASGGQRRADRVRRGGQHAHPAKERADAGRRHQRVVGGAVERSVGPEAAPPLDADGPRVPHERRPGMDADEQRRRLWEPVPAVDLHPKPEVDQGIEDVLRAIDQGVIARVE